MMKKICSLCLIALGGIALSCGVIFGEDRLIVNGWRYPVESDIILDWKDFRNTNPEPYHCFGDFNGDALRDEANILINEKTGKGGLFVFLSQPKGSHKVIQLDNIEKSSIQRMGISTVKPGKYKTACGKGYWPCKNDEAPEIILYHEALDYLIFESANSFFYWSEKNRDFERTWMSD